MKESYSKLLSRPFVRYLLVGGSAYILELLVIVIARIEGASNIVAVALSFWVGLVYSFILQKFFSFGDKRTHRKVLLPQMLMAAALVIFNFTFTIVITDLLQHVLPAIITRTVAIAATTIWNFRLYKTRVFNEVVID